MRVHITVEWPYSRDTAHQHFDVNGLVWGSHYYSRDTDHQRYDVNGVVWISQMDFLH